MLSVAFGKIGGNHSILENEDILLKFCKIKI